jgi:hypothetical protein
LESPLKFAINQQFESAIDMLENVIVACPDNLWQVRLWEDSSIPSGLSEFWYLVYHTLFWLDLYLSGEIKGFMPPDPFNLDELDPSGVVPDRIYSKAEMLNYLEHNRRKCHSTINNLTDVRAVQTCRFPWGQVTFAELILDNMRHVQEHTAQLNLILGQKIGWNPSWVATAAMNSDE